MKPKWYEIISRAVEEGAALGVNRAFKHTDKPERHGIIESVEREVLNCLCEVLDFGDPE